jgi:valyl-tRNA synthetase
MIPLDKTYNAAEVEARWYRRCLDEKAFHDSSGRGGTPYTIVIPPPNVTGILHMGHALNNTIQDILVRWRRMQGRNTLWVPGTDHAGIATQNVVERALREEGKGRHDLGREAFVRRVWEWKESYGSTITWQLKMLGASCDWERERFTLDPGLSRAVTEVFIRLYEKKLIYRGNYIINWCPRCATALSDEESEHEPVNGRLYYIRYPFKDGAGRKPLVVATTRPETMLGDVAVAVNPRDERYHALVGQTLTLPILGRTLPIIADDFVDPQFGTGAVKVTPAHDPNDFAMGQRHRLEPITVMDDAGVMNDQAGPYKGLDRFECRRRLVEDLTQSRFLEKVEDHAHAVGHCYRCHTVVEPRLSMQWFVRMKPLARPAMEAVKDGRIRFYPERWTRVYLDWMENIRDWCISRQIWWGHRIPVYYCDDGGHEWAAAEPPQACPTCGSARIRQDPDVLDTWFSSWLWPFSTLGWPERTPDLAFYYPTDTLVTASEIIFFWVARMVMAGLEFMGEVPFRQVFIHGTVRDESGRKMSKSLGNAIDPLEVIKEYSADALRFSLMMVTAVEQDLYLSNQKFEVGRNFLTKIWNAARFMQMHAEGLRFEVGKPALDSASLGTDDRHILAVLHERVASCTESLEKFRFNDAARDLYDFVWHQFCDWYIEYAKVVLNGSDAARREQVRQVMHEVFATSLRLLHPMIPFLTEELWHAMGYGGPDDLLLRAAWPAARDQESLAEWGVDARTVRYVEDKHEIIRLGRNLRADYSLSPSMKIRYIIRPETDEQARLLTAERDIVAALLRAGDLTIEPGFAPAAVMPHGSGRLGTIFMPIEGLIDAAAERARLGAQLEAVTRDLGAVNRKLDNIAFVQKAPPKVVEQQRSRKQELLEKGEKLRRLLDVLGGLGG